MIAIRFRFRPWSLLLIASMTPALVFAGGSPRRISGQHEGNCFTPIISPDGKRVAYEVNYFERRVIELYIYEIASGRETQVDAASGGAGLLSDFGVSGAQSPVTYELAWSPMSPDLYAYAASGGGDKNFDIFLSVGGSIASHPAADGMAAWSSDGQLIAFTSSRTGEGDLYLIDINTIEQPPVQLTDDAASTEWYPAWSRVGREILFVKHYSKGGDNLYLIRDIGDPKGSVVQLTDWPSIQTKPSWSPNGKQIAFYSNRTAKERYDVYVMAPVPGAAPRLVMEGIIPNDRLGPTWSPDGKKLIVVKDDPEHFNPIRLVSVSDPSKTRIISTGTQNNGDTSIVTTPDGQSWLAFTAQGQIGDKRKAFKLAYIYPLDKNDIAPSW